MVEDLPSIGWYFLVAAFFLALPILSRLLLQPANDPSLIGFSLNLLLLGLTTFWALDHGVKSYGGPFRYDATRLAALMGVISGTSLVLLWIPWNH